MHQFPLIGSSPIASIPCPVNSSYSANGHTLYLQRLQNSRGKPLCL